MMRLAGVLLLAARAYSAPYQPMAHDFGPTVGPTLALYACPPGSYVTQVTLHAAFWLESVASITCWNPNTRAAAAVPVAVGLAGTGAAYTPANAEGFSGASAAAFAAGSVAATSVLTLFGYDGERTNTFGTKFDQGSFNIFNCPTGMKIVGLRLIATGNDPPYVGGFGVTCGAVPLLCDTECMLLTKEANPAYQPNYPAPEFLVEQCNNPVKGTCVGVHLKGAASKAMCVVKNSCVSALVEDGASMDCNAIGSCPLSTFTGLGTLGMCNAYYACSKAAFGKGARAECNAAGACEEARFVDAGTHAVCTPGACVKSEFYLGASVECNGEYACGDIILNGYGTKVLCTSADACLPQPPLPVPQPGMPPPGIQFQDQACCVGVFCPKTAPLCAAA